MIPSSCIQFELFENPTTTRIKEIVNADNSFTDGLVKVGDLVRGKIMNKNLEHHIEHIVNSYLEQYFLTHNINHPHWNCCCEFDDIRKTASIKFNTIARVLISVEEAQRRIDEYGQGLLSFEEQEGLFIRERNLRLQEILDRGDK